MWTDSQRMWFLLVWNHWNAWGGEFPAQAIERVHWCMMRELEMEMAGREVSYL